MPCQIEGPDAEELRRGALQRNQGQGRGVQGLGRAVFASDPLAALVVERGGVEEPARRRGWVGEIHRAQ